MTATLRALGAQMAKCAPAAHLLVQAPVAAFLEEIDVVFGQHWCLLSFACAAPGPDA
jgi:hypothetical protein